MQYQSLLHKKLSKGTFVYTAETTPPDSSNKDILIERIKGYNGKRALSVLEQSITNQLPLLGMVAAGMPIETFDNHDLIEVPPSLYENGNYVLKVNGNSMKDDGILDGDYVVIKKIEVLNSQPVEFGDDLIFFE